MGIRDSLRPLPEQEQARRHAEQRRRKKEAEGHRDGPVSYTHLRAHETVLDLVCGLLLEKQNANSVGDGEKD